MIYDWVKNLLFNGRMVAVDTNFVVSADYIESLVKGQGIDTWGWRLRDGVMTFYVSELDAQYIKNFLLRRKFLSVVI